MKERVEPKNRLLKQEASKIRTPTVPLRSFIRKTLQENGEQSPFIRTVIAFGDGLHYIEKRIGQPEYHVACALKTGRKQSLSKEEMERAFAYASNLYAEYKNPPPEDLVLKAEKAKRKVEEEEKRLRVEQKKRRLQQRFTNLMTFSDEELQIMSANQRVDFPSDFVYQNSDRTIMALMRERRLTEAEYLRVAEEIREPTIVLKIQPYVDRDELLALSRYILDDKPMKSQLGEERFLRFVQYVFALLRGDRLPKSELTRNGFDPAKVLSKARTVLNHYYIDVAEKERLMKNPLPAQARISTKKGTDPHVFLGDGSHKKDLGYIQSWPDPDKLD